MQFLPCRPQWAVVAILLATLFPATAQGQRFAAIGDYGFAGPAEREVAELVRSWNPEFVITLGDNNYHDGLASTIDENVGQYYHEFIAPYPGRFGRGAAINNFFPCIGNHDTHTGAGRPYLDYFTLPGNERYYDFVRGQVHFFVLNSDPTEPDGTGRFSRQARWLRARLTASTAAWRVVYFHQGPYSSGAHGNSRFMRWPFQEWGASLVLSGHDHHYERLLVNGLVYCVNGLGGRSTSSLKPTPEAGSQLRYNEDFGAQLFEASADSLRARFYTRRGHLVDSFTLRKGQGTVPELLAVLPAPEMARIEYSLPAEEKVLIRLLDARGKAVRVLHQGRQRAGRHELLWSRQGLAAGTYFVQLRCGRYTPVKRAVLL